MIILDYLSLFKKKLRSKKESYSFGTIDILVNLQHLKIVLNKFCLVLF